MRKTVFKASCCVLREIPVRAEKPLHKTKKKNKVAQSIFNRGEIFLLTADLISRANHPPLEGHGFLAMGGITGLILHLKNFACTMLHPRQWKKAEAPSDDQSSSFLSHLFSPLSFFVSYQSLFTLHYRLQGCASPFHSWAFWGDNAITAFHRANFYSWGWRAKKEETAQPVMVIHWSRTRDSLVI